MLEHLQKRQTYASFNILRLVVKVKFQGCPQEL